jgi:hypothetical protein
VAVHAGIGDLLHDPKRHEHLLIHGLGKCNTPYVSLLLDKVLWVTYFFNVSSGIVGELPHFIRCIDAHLVEYTNG